MTDYFCIASNARSGSSYLATSLSLLPDVIADFEVKWKMQGKGNAVHVDLYRNDTTVIQELRKVKPERNVKGSRFILDPWFDYSLGDLDGICERFEPDVTVVVILRNLWEIMLSGICRGFFNILDNPEDQRLDPSTVVAASLKECTNLYGDRGASYHVQEVDDERVLQYLLSISKNTLISIELARRAKNAYVVRYENIGAELPSIAKAIGSSASEEAVIAATRRPVTKKLEPIPDAMIPNWEVLKPIAQYTYMNILDSFEKNVPVKNVWVADNKIAFSGFDLQCD